jgi:CheY-like chemotaxis protein
LASVQPTTAPFSVSLPKAASDQSGSPDLPVIGTAIPRTSATEEGHELPRRTGRRVLVVEDESPVRQMLSELLEGGGYGVVQAVDGLEALQVLRGDRPDLIVLDLMLPRMSGLQFLEQSREELDRRNIPVLIVSAIADQGADPRGLGVAAWLSKPVDMDRFLAAVESLAGPAHRVPHGRSRASAERTIRVLVVEDDVPIREIVVDYLRDEGYLADAAGSVREARERIAANAPDLILLDLMLPDRSGWDFLRDRRNDVGLADIRVLVLSAAPRNLLLEARDLGADAFLSKPFDLDVLNAMVESFVA